MVGTRRGFTLFEVMAAVLVMGLIFAVLAQVNIEGVMAEGLSRRRLQASLLADEVLGDLEDEVLAGGFPEEGSREEERGDFRVRVDVQPFDPSPYLALQDEPETPGARRPSEPVASLLDPPAAGQPSLIRRFDVAVSWSETGGLGDEEQVVRRTTFAYDAAAVAPYVEAAAPGGTSGDESAEGAGSNSQDTGTSSGGRGSSGGGSSKDAEIQRMLEQLRGIEQQQGAR